MKKTILIWGLFVILTVVMLILSATVYRLWVGDNVSIPIGLSIVCGVYVTISNWNNIFAYMLNDKASTVLFNSCWNTFFSISLLFGS